MSTFTFEENIPVIKNKSKANNKFNFIETDTESDYIINKEKIGHSWYYYEKEIVYEYNSWGYRSKDFTELKDDYILTFGCSFTEGIGLCYDDLWSTKMSKKLNYDVLNLGMGGTGPDFTMYNSILYHNFILQNGKIPKLVIYQWSFTERTSYFFIDNKTDKIYQELFSLSYPEKYYPPNSKYYLDWHKYSFLENKGEMIKQSNISSLICNNIWRSLNVPVINWTWGKDFTLTHKDQFNNNLTIHRIQDDTKIKARDCAHNGHVGQDIVVNFLLNLL